MNDEPRFSRMTDNAHQLVKNLIKNRLGGLDETTEVIETHISIVMLTSKFAYKLKKPVNFGFVDFSSIEKRKFYCEEEIRLNKRLAADLYIGVIPVTGSISLPAFGDGEDVIEYLVKMHRFNSDAELEAVTQRQASVTRQFTKFAGELAQFHHGAPVAGPHSLLGRPEQVLNDVKDNYCAFKSANFSALIFNRVSRVRSWSNLESKKLRHILGQRKKEGFIRECHGDLHLRNLVLLDDKIVAFDCLEFNAELRWIDVASELAFLLMDLSRAGLDVASSAVLNRYLECTGDYAALAVLRFYMVYRAMVRAKVAFLRVDSATPKEEARLAIEPYISVAENIISQSKSPPSLIVTYGLSGSGKSWISKRLREYPGVIHIRSDIVRNTMASQSTTDAGMSDVDKYSSGSRENVYTELENIAHEILSAGYSVIVDATFLDARLRGRFQTLAARVGVSYRILQLKFPLAVLESRIGKRRRQGGDPSEADLSVLHDQIGYNSVLSEEEKEFVTAIDEHSPLDKNGITQLARQLHLV